MSAVSGEARCEIGARIIKACSSLAGCRCVCRIDGNLWQFSTVSFARSAMAGWAKSPSVRAGSQSVSRIHWSRFFVGILRCDRTHSIATAALPCVAQRRTTDLVGLALRTPGLPKHERSGSWRATFSHRSCLVQRLLIPDDHCPEAEREIRLSAPIKGQWPVPPATIVL